MNPTTTSSHFTLHAYRTFTHPLSSLRLILLFVMLAFLSSFSVPAAEPPNPSHPPSRTVSASPALRTSHARNALCPQSDTGWYYADDSRLMALFYSFVLATTVTLRRPPLVRPMQTAITGSSTRRISSPISTTSRPSPTAGTATSTSSNLTAMESSTLHTTMTPPLCSCSSPSNYLWTIDFNYFHLNLYPYVTHSVPARIRGHRMSG